MATPTVEIPIPPVPSAQTIDNKGAIISQPWQQWFVNLRDKINVINANLVGWAGLPTASGVTPGTYGDISHYPVITVDVTGRITAASSLTLSGGSGGILPVVTGEIISGQPVFVILTDGSLVYTQVQ